MESERLSMSIEKRIGKSEERLVLVEGEKEKINLKRLLSETDETKRRGTTLKHNLMQEGFRV